MGNNNQVILTTEQLRYYCDTKDINIGVVQIFTCQSLPMVYIMKMIYKSEQEQSFKLFQKIEVQKCKSIITFYGFKKGGRCDCENMNRVAMFAYWQYYNFYLCDLLEYRNSNKITFSEFQIWHLISVCTQGYLLFHHHNLLFDFHPTKLVVTPEGRLKLFWAHFNIKNSHLKYINYFLKKEFDQNYYSPEELKEIKANDRNLKLDFPKINSFSFGMLVLTCCTGISAMKYYKHYKIDFASIKSIICDKVAKSYSKQIVTLLQSCLNENSQSRKTLYQIHQQYSPYFKEEQFLTIANTPSSKTQTQKSTYTSSQNKISLRKKI